MLLLRRKRHLNHFRCQADDLQESLVAQLTSDGAEDAGAARVLVFFVDENERVAIEAHRAAILASDRLLDADDAPLDDFAGLDIAAGERLLDAGDDDVAEAR